MRSRLQKRMSKFGAAEAEACWVFSPLLETLHPTTPIMQLSIHPPPVSSFDLQFLSVSLYSNTWQCSAGYLFFRAAKSCRRQENDSCVLSGESCRADSARLLSCQGGAVLKFQKKRKLLCPNIEAVSQRKWFTKNPQLYVCVGILVSPLFITATCWNIMWRSRKSKM